jgi:hypothetical protein
MGRLQWKILGAVFLVMLVGMLCVAMLAWRSLLERPTPIGTPATRTHLMAPTTFHEVDLLGRWEKTFTKYDTEVLILTADHRFVQMYDLAAPTRHYVGQGTWYVDSHASGCVYVHFVGMRYFYGAEAFELYGNRFSPHDSPYQFWERCETQWITMPDKVILTVSDRPNFPRGIGLLFPADGNPPDGSIEMEVVADADGQLVPTPTRPRRSER